MRTDAWSSAEQPPAGLVPGLDAVGAYHLLRPLGMGGMASVWLAVDARCGKVVAIKRMLPSMIADPELRRGFVQEAELGLRLRHANIVETIELGELTTANGVEPYIVLELLQGRPIIDVLRTAARRRLPLPLAFAVRAIVDAARALDHAHKVLNADGNTLGLVHRDVSPHNLFACADGQIKLLDFGIAKTSSQEHRTRTGQIKGKLAYLSPEQIRGHALDARVDVFGLGIVLHEMLVGRPLFRGDNEAETLHRVLSHEVVAPDSVRPEVPPGLSAIALRALQRDRDRRLPSAGALADAVEAVAEAAGIQSSSVDVCSFVGELFPKDARTQAEDSALVRRTYEYLSSGSLRAITSDPWLTPAEGVQHSAVSSRGADWLRRGALLVGAVTITFLAAFATTNLLRRHANQNVAARRETASTKATAAPRPEAPLAGTQAPAIALPSPRLRSTTKPVARELAEAPVVEPAASAPPPGSPHRESSHRAERARSAHGEPGRLRVAAHPWAEVSIDGRPAGTTPLPATGIAPGRHTIVFANGQLGVTVHRRVTVVANEESVVVVDLFKEKARSR